LRIEQQQEDIRAHLGVVGSVMRPQQLELVVLDRAVAATLGLQQLELVVLDRALVSSLRAFEYKLLELVVLGGAFVPRLRAVDRLLGAMECSRLCMFGRLLSSLLWPLALKDCDDQSG